MKNKGSILITIVIIFLVLFLLCLGIVFYLAPKLKISRPTKPSEFTKPDWFKTKEEMKEIIATVAPAPAINFTYDGHLIKQGSGSDSESWTFLYEGPGAPAQTANLIFNHFSVCDLGGGEKSCQINLRQVESGTKVHLEGNKENDIVTVIKLKRLD